MTSRGTRVMGQSGNNGGGMAFEMALIQDKDSSASPEDQERSGWTQQEEAPPGVLSRWTKAATQDLTVEVLEIPGGKYHGRISSTSDRTEGQVEFNSYRDPFTAFTKLERLVRQLQALRPPFAG